MFVARADKSGNLRYVAGIPGVFGFRDGPGERALFSGIRVIAKGPQGRFFILDRGNCCIRELSKAGGRWWFGPAKGAAGAGSNIVAVDSRGDLYSVDHLFCGVRKVHYTGKDLPSKATKGAEQ